MIKVNGSSNIAGYDHDASKSEMLVQFHSGKVYNHYDVPGDIAHGIAKAQSAGKYYNEHIKGKYSYNELKDPSSVERVS